MNSFPHREAPNIVRRNKPMIIALDNERIPILRKILAKVNREDPYSLSPSYYAFTGRKGLWFYGEEYSGMIIAQHPNDEDKVLYFPPFGTYRSQLIEDALKDKDLPQGEVRLARLGPDDLDLVTYFNGHSGVLLDQENELDWTFDVQILNIQKVIDRKGDGFKDFRNNINRTEQLNLRVEYLNQSYHQEAIEHVIGEWGKIHANGYSEEDLTNPTLEILRLKENKYLPINGIIIFEDNHPISFFLWEETCPEQGLANGLCNATISQYKGVSEYTYLEACRTLQERGFSNLCIGGSERFGLDRFKRKMQPEKSIPLKTMVLSY